MNRQESIMIPVLLCVLVATLRLKNHIARRIACHVIFAQLFVHILMCIRPFRCNIHENRMCNIFALIAGCTMLIIFTSALIYDEVDLLNIIAVFCATYSIVSHVVHIDVNELLADNSLFVSSCIAGVILTVFAILQYKEHIGQKNDSRK